MSTTGIVLSGGGARGAYEAGVMTGIVEALGLGPDDPAPIQVFTGSSVGAINTAFLAAHADRGDLGAEGLADVWRRLRLKSHLRIDPLRFLGVRQRFRRLVDRDAARSLGVSLFDTAALDSVVVDAIPWPRLRANIDRGDVRALVIAALRVADGRTTMFADLAGGMTFRPSKDPRRSASMEPISAAHVLASAAIPLVFPARRIGRSWYCDGGLRFNTPIAPAIRCGVDRLLVVSLLHQPFGAPTPIGSLQSYPNPLFLLGKVLNALLLDPVEYDLAVLQRFNRLVEVLDHVLTDDELARVDREMTELRGQPYRKLDTLVFSPSVDLGEVAGQHLRDDDAAEEVGALGRWLLRRAAAHDATWEDDLASYVLFDGAYAERLIEVGRRDVLSRRDEVRAFFRR